VGWSGCCKGSCLPLVSIRKAATSSRKLHTSRANDRARSCRREPHRRSNTFAQSSIALSWPGTTWVRYPGAALPRLPRRSECFGPAFEGSPLRHEWRWKKPMSWRLTSQRNRQDPGPCGSGSLAGDRLPPPDLRHTFPGSVGDRARAVVPAWEGNRRAGLPITRYPPPFSLSACQTLPSL
jgi:hypothetical protein